MATDDGILVVDGSFDSIGGALKNVPAHELVVDGELGVVTLSSAGVQGSTTPIRRV